ncbi:MAG: hypothetical protein OXC07_05315 [Kistimonas sp.]|nr:hypothetical protein [Kistimonas sp.]
MQLQRQVGFKPQQCHRLALFQCPLQWRWSAGEGRLPLRSHMQPVEQLVQAGSGCDLDEQPGWRQLLQSQIEISRGAERVESDGGGPRRLLRPHFCFRAL